MQLIELARQRLRPQWDLNGLGVPAIQDVEANHTEDAMPRPLSASHPDGREARVWVHSMRLFLHFPLTPKAMRMAQSPEPAGERQARAAGV